MLGQLQGQRLCAARPGWGTSRVVRVWGSVSGHPCPVRLGQPGPSYSHLDLQLVGARVGRSHLTRVPTWAWG